MDESGSSSESGLGQDAQDLSKVAYVAQACIFCKKRHLKCDGMTPCVQCHLRSQDCIYEGSKKRGRKPTSDDAKKTVGSAKEVPATPNAPETPSGPSTRGSTNQPSSGGKRSHSQTNQSTKAPPPKRAKLAVALETPNSNNSSRNLQQMSVTEMPDTRVKTEPQTRRSSKGSSSNSSSSSSSGVSSPADDANQLSREALLALVERQRSALNELTSTQTQYTSYGAPAPASSSAQKQASKSRARGGNQSNRPSSDKKNHNDTRTTLDDSSDSGGFDDAIHINSHSSNSSDDAAEAKRRRRVLYADPSLSAATLMTVFVNRNSFLFPTGRPPVDASASTAYFNSFKSKSAFKNLLKSDINTLTEAFSYGVAFALGAKAVAKWGLVKDFIFHTNNKLLEKILKKDLSTQPNSSLYLVRVISGVCFHIMLHVACGDVPEARNCALLAFNLMNQYQNAVIKTLQYTVYTHMASLCTRPQEKLHFLDCAEKLGQGSAPPVNQVILAVFVTGEILSKNEPLFNMEHFTEKTTAQDFEYRLKLHQYCAAALDSIDHHPAFAHGRNVLMAATLKMMVSGCRSLAALQIGKHDEALAWASTTIQVVKYVDTTILPMLITVSLAYAVHVAVVMQQRDLFCMGMARLKQFTGLYPIAVRLWNRLVAQGQLLASDATFIVALPEWGTQAFAQYQQQIQNAAQNPSGSSTSTPSSSSSGSGASTSPSDNTPNGSSPSANSNSSSSSSSAPNGGVGSNSTNVSPSMSLAGPNMFSSNFPLTPLGMTMGSGPGSAGSGSGGSASSPPSHGNITPNGGFDSQGLGYGTPNGNSYTYGMMSDMYPSHQTAMPQTHQHHMHQNLGLSGFGMSPPGLSPFGMSNVVSQQHSDLLDANMNIKTSPPEFQSGYDDSGVM